MSAPSHAVAALACEVDTGHDPRTGAAHPGVAHTTANEVARAVAAAAGSAPRVGSAAPAVRAMWLESIAASLEEHADELVALAEAETALGQARLGGELTKAAASLRFYGSVAADGAYLQATIDTSDTPTPLDLRRMRLPVGPVAVFGASNFPFGFGVLGHDTASAIAAGCPVVVKAHPAHPRLSVRLGEIAVVIEYADLDQLREALGRLQPSLAATIASAGADDADLGWLVQQLASRAGRVVVDGWPTGVATTWAQHHGGPWPSTSRPDATSVGAAALDRFTRPVAFQGTADAALPPALQNDNPWALPRRVNSRPRSVTDDSDDDRYTQTGGS
jgi:acyl-CoA reductase-like NAD-dependent aldehyde dehydrogenase